MLNKLTCDGLGDNGGVVVGVVARVEKVVVECPVEPVVEELHGAHVKQNSNHRSVRSPQRRVLCPRNESVAQIEQPPIEKDLIIPDNNTC